MRLNPFHAQCAEILEAHWGTILEREDLTADIVPERAVAIGRLLRAKAGVASSFRFVLPTQLVAKLADPALDSRALQLRKGEGGTFNARDVAKKVVVPLNRANGAPLGSASDPYVNNPLRVPRLSAEYREQQADKELWDLLCEITEDVEVIGNPQLTSDLLDQTLLEMRRLVEELQITYAIPARISQTLLLQHIREYLHPRTGGRRFQAVCVALFRAAGQHWGIYDEVVSGAINAADAPGRRPADIECRKDGETVLAAEAKDVALTLELLEDKIQSSRMAGVRELLFLVRAEPITGDPEVIGRADREFAAGHNIYLIGADAFMNSMLAWLGEPGRHTFARMLGEVLEEYGYDYADRRAWSDILNHW